jgi:hypothetical protein
VLRGFKTAIEESVAFKLTALKSTGKFFPKSVTTKPEFAKSQTFIFLLKPSDISVPALFKVAESMRGAEPGNKLWVQFSYYAAKLV